MITCKEDLVGKYVARADLELFELFMLKCEEFGIKWCSGKAPREVTRQAFVSVNSSCNLEHGYTPWSVEVALLMEDLTDVPKQTPKTKVEYVKVDLTPKQIFSALLEGEEFYIFEEEMFFDGTQFLRGGDRITYINDDHEVTRKVETEVSWWGGFMLGEGCT